MTTFLISAVIGVLVGIASGMLGIGGGMFMVPIFRLGYGLQAVAATATSLFAIVPTSAAGLVAHVRNKTCFVSIGVAAGLGGACTSPIGVYLASISPSWMIMLAAAGVIAYSSITMFRKALALSAAISSTRASNQFEPSEEEDVLTRRKIIQGALIGLGAGLGSGYVGVGGGFIMIPLFVSIIHMGMKKASGTSLMGICILAIPGVISQLILGNVHVVAAVSMSAGAIPGAVMGANLIRRVPERLLRFVFSGLLVATAMMLVINEFGIFD